MLGLLFMLFNLVHTSQAIVEITATLPCPDDEIPFNSLCIPKDQSYLRAYKFLLDNLPSWDLSNSATLGFHNSTGQEVDGLEDGIATIGINSSLTTKQKNPWARDVSEDIFYEYVVPYAHVNEARNNWRPFLTTAVNQILAFLEPDISLASVSDVVDLLNNNLWDSGVLGNKIIFKSSQTPLIYDPMSTIVYGYASCTGVSILFADSLRAAGIPARVAGTPAWNQVTSHGNHNWVEVYDQLTEAWHFLEASPAGGGESLTNPCDKWFCTKEKMENGTKVFATRWQFDTSGTVYPMAWDMDNKEIPGVDRTQYYQDVCNKC